MCLCWLGVQWAMVATVAALWYRGHANRSTYAYSIRYTQTLPVVNEWDSNTPTAKPKLITLQCVAGVVGTSACEAIRAFTEKNADCRVDSISEGRLIPTTAHGYDEAKPTTRVRLSNP